MTAVIAVTSGTAQTGKTVLGANLAHYLSTKENKTALLVAGSDNPVLEVAPNSTWPNIISGRIPIAQAIQSTASGLDVVVTQGHGHTLGSLTNQATDQMADSIEALEQYAYLVVDMAAGIAGPTVACCLAATESILVITADTAALTAAYDWLARLSKYGFKGPINMVLNQVKKPALAQSVFIRFKDLAQKRLNLQVNLWGALSHDKDILESNVHEFPLSIARPSSKLLREIQVIGDRLLAEQPPENQTQPLGQFWKTFISRLQALPVMPVRQQARQNELEVVQDVTITHEKQTTQVKQGSDGSADVSATLQQITGQLSAIAGELGTIRRLMENGSVAGGTADSNAQNTEEIQMILDFDAFVASQKAAKDSA